jgi:4'-phosphopantetheinyl transferase
VRDDEITWLIPPADIALSPDDVHIWRAWLDLPADRVRQAEQTLSPGELAKATRFRFEQDRRRYVAAHSALRAILARYLDMPREEVLLEQARGGKPRLAVAENELGLHFSMADSEDIALYAVVRNADVGVDVELIRPIAEEAQIAAHFFSTAEKAAFAVLPQEQRLRAFYAYWTVKEAYTKAIGAGLAYPLDRLAVAIEGGGLAVIDGDVDEAARWFSTTFCPRLGYAAAVVVRRLSPQLSLWQYAELQQSPPEK